MTYRPLELDYYKILDISRHASKSEMEEAWKQRLREYDVEKLRYFGKKLHDLAEEETRLINEAYEVLSDPEKRRAYNQTIGRRVGRKDGIQKIQDLKKYIQKQADIHNNRAIQYWQELQYEKAITEWQKGIKAAPSVPELYHNLASACLSLKRFEEAIEVGERTIRLYPNFSEAFHNLGCAYYKVGEPNLAAQNWKMALELDPDCVEAHKNLDMLISNSIISPDSDVSPYKVELEENNKPQKGIFSRAFDKFRKKT